MQQPSALELPPQLQCYYYNYPGQSYQSEHDSEDKAANPADLTIDDRRTSTRNTQERKRTQWKRE